MKFSYNFSALCTTYVLSCFALCCVANRVKTMHDLLSSSGWHIMAHPIYRVNIIDRRRPDEPERQLTVNYLLGTSVTEENVVDKIQVAHQFLSCSYARVLIGYFAYEKGIGPYCRSEDCLQDYLLIIRYKNPMISRMAGALSSLQDLASSQTHFEKAVFIILEDSMKYHQQKTVVRPPDDEDLTADAESEAIEQHARVMLNRLLAFYNRFCRPFYIWIQNRGFAIPKQTISEFAVSSSNNSVSVVDKIKEKLIKIIKGFTESHDNTSGIEYDAESKTSRIMTYDPNVIERVEKTNRLLGYRYYWDLLTRLQIIERDSPYSTTIDDLLRPTVSIVMVTKENVHTKLKRAHQFLSCKFACIIMECCQHVTSMWSECQNSEDSVCLEKFLQILNEADPSVLGMIDVLSNFHELSPDTVYNDGVFDLLKRFKNFYGDRTARTDRDVMSLSTEIEKDISEIAQNSTEFFQQFCYSDIELDFSRFLLRNNESTIDDKGEIFKIIISTFTWPFDVFR